MESSIETKISTFFTKYKKQTYKKNDILIRAEDDPSGIFYLQEGIVRQYYISKNGAEITLNMFKTHAFFPMSWAISHIPNNYFFEAMNDCIAYKAPSQEVLLFLKKEPTVMMDLL